ncbi:TolB protein [gamma proteobacterium HdN1]|nr:TolB protein [gamma proteobacterium HdN1]
MLNRAFIKIVLFWAAFALATFAHAELRIEVSKGADNATPIAVVPFAWESGGRASDEISTIISADLYRSGMFKPLARSDMLSWPTRADQVFFRDWKALGMEYLVIGRWSNAGGKYTASFEIFDVLAGRTMKSATASASNPRWLAHYTADLIFEALTGIKGAFATRLLYVTMERHGPRNQRYRLLVSDSDGYNEKVIRDSKEPILSPSWAPNGRHITYVAFQHSHPGIYIQDTMTGSAQRITSFPGLNGAPRFSPDGQKLALTLSKDGNPEIYVVDTRTRALQRVTSHFAIDTEANWSPDGGSLIYTSDRSGGPQIYRQSLATGAVERLTFDGNYNARASMTPDGRFLAMVHQDSGGFQIAVQDLERGSFNVLTDTPLDESPSIAPNGTMVIYATLERGRGVLGVVSIDGRVKVRLPSSVGEVREPAWSPFMF